MKQKASKFQKFTKLFREIGPRKFQIFITNFEQNEILIEIFETKRFRMFHYSIDF